ncbi:MAG: efflux RND transporter periplasmic adaptor subunit [Pseudomonadota bacterium]
MNQENRQISTLPPVLRKEMEGERLTLFRVKKGDLEEYRLERGKAAVITFSAWQYHVLNALFSFGGDQYSTLLANVNERFGLTLAQDDMEALFASLREKQLFDAKESPNHPLTKPFCGAGTETRATAPGAPKAQQAGTSSKTAGESLWKTVYIFNPAKYLASVRPLLPAGRYLVYPLPFLLFAAFIILWQHTPSAEQDFSDLLRDLNIITGVAFNVVTVSVLAAFTLAATAYARGATVNSISVILLYYFIPRFVVRMEDTEKFSRREKLWLHASPLLAQLWLFCLGILLWYSGRPLGGIITIFGATLAFDAAITFLDASCPFNKNSGYYFLAELLNEPNIRDKAFLTLLNKWKKNVYVQTDSNVLLIYALACICFTAGLLAVILYSLHAFLDVEFGTESLVVIGALMLGIGLKLRDLLKKINEDYAKRQQLVRWRERVLPEDSPESKAPAPPYSFGKKIAITTAVLFLLAPYPYRPSGQVVLSPVAQQQISTDIAGIVDEVNFDGGELLEKGTVVARLSVSDSRAQLKIQQATLAERQATLETAKNRAAYSESNCGRQRKLYASGSISFDKLEAAERECSIDKLQAIEAEAALEPIQAQIDLYKDRIARSEFKMPFTGKLATLHLKEKKGKFLDIGVPLAEAEDDSSFEVVVEIPEEDASGIKVGADADIRLAAYPDNSFRGVVKTIDPDAKDKSYGKMIQMIVTFENKGDSLKSGMSGYAKVRGDSLMGWEMLTRPIFRFLTVEVWAWMPW